MKTQIILAFLIASKLTLSADILNMDLETIYNDFEKKEEQFQQKHQLSHTNQKYSINESTFINGGSGSSSFSQQKIYQEDFENNEIDDELHLIFN
jgi:hypothetical protein